MASKTTITLEDDLEGGPAEETVRFRLGTVEYEIDLNTRNADWPVRPIADRQHSAEVRAWAKEDGIAINQRGRIPTAVIKQYETATQR